ncbi:MAG: nucleotidyl transferase AbiEii/AbiGii toxin family protein [Thermoplasmata archaeon]
MESEEMIGMQELRRVARTKGITNMSYAEKDYFQEILLLGISREAPELAFKGGTSLYKLHGLDRFSEDLDFTGEVSEKQIKAIAGYLEDFGYPTKTMRNKPKAGLLLTFASEGFLYQGTPESMARVQMDISPGELMLEPEWKQIFPLYPDIPSFRVKAMSLQEVLAEKLRAMTVRKKARDAYDIWFMLNRGVEFDKKLTQKKLDMYELKFGKKLLEETLADVKASWGRELRALMAAPPDFERVKAEIMKIT